MSDNRSDDTHTGRVDLCDPFVSLLPVARAAISTLVHPFDVETICASDALAAHLDELQLDLGEGPCWESLKLRAPILELDVQNTQNPAWPSLHNAIASFGVHSVYAFPMLVGTLEIGAVDLYVDTALSFTAEDIQRASALADITAMHVLQRALDSHQEAESQTDELPYSRRQVHQATGMVLAQMKISAEDALLLIRAHAFSSGKSVREVAALIVDRQITFPQ